MPRIAKPPQVGLRKGGTRKSLCLFCGRPFMVYTRGRWKAAVTCSEHRRRKYLMQAMWGPKKADHPTIGMDCHICGEHFVEGDFTTGMFAEPTDDEEQSKADAGMPYTAIVEEVHWGCWELAYRA